jgi:hypothetical protein
MMTVNLTKSAFADATAESVQFSQFLSMSASSSNPAYIIVSGLDRNEYTASSTGATGTITGNGHTATFSSIGGDERSIGIIFTYNAATGTYTNGTYGNLANLTYNTSSSPNDLTDITLFGTNSLAYANAYSQLGYAMSETPSQFTELGTVSFATQKAFVGTSPSQATPGSISSTALTFVGATWNENGCWVLANTIDAEAGASLSIASNACGIAGAANGEWKVEYNGPVSANANWAAGVKAGDEIVMAFGTASGHITTVVSGSGGTAMVVDNAYFGTNGAKDGNAADITTVRSISQINQRTILYCRSASVPGHDPFSLDKQILDYHHQKELSECVTRYFSGWTVCSYSIQISS